MLEAIFGLVGVVVGAAITGFQSWLGARRTRLASARYLAVRVVCLLDKYIDDCTSVVCDDGLSFGQRNRDGYLEAQVASPAPVSFPDDVDWRTIDHDLMYDLLSLPNRAESADGAISFAAEVDHPPDFDEYFEARRRHYSDLGLRSYALAQRLRQSYRIPDLVFGGWNPIDRLTKEKQAIEQRDHERANRERPDFPGSA